MSTFNGIIKHFPWLSIDRFDGDNLNSKLFLLSHAHWDHMQGIKKPEFRGPLYLSAITKLFLEYEQLNIEYHVLEIGEPVLLKCDVGEVLVTTFPAYHCPGSVMFVLQNKDITVLYTGDFRFQLNDLEKMTMLKQFHFDEIYLDSTFFRRDYHDFPTQQESVDRVCSLINEWLWKDSTNKVYLDTSARYGYEYLFIAIHKKLKKQICVPLNEYNKYRHIPELNEATTSNPQAAIHAVRSSFFQKAVNTDVPLQNQRRIRISAMRWKQWKSDKDISEPNGDSNDLYVCYSNHSSCSEIRDLIKYLKPKRVFLNCVPKENETIKAEMYELLRDTMKEIACECDDMKESGADTNLNDHVLKLSLSSIPKVGSKRRLMDTEIRPLPKFKKRLNK